MRLDKFDSDVPAPEAAGRRVWIPWIRWLVNWFSPPARSHERWRPCPVEICRRGCLWRSMSANSCLRTLPIRASDTALTLPIT